MTAITHIPRTAQTFTSVYDSATANDFSTKTLAQIGIVSTDTVALTAGKLELGPTYIAGGYAHNRATFPSSLKYGRLIAEFLYPADPTLVGVFGGQLNGFDYFGYNLTTIHANTTGANATASEQILSNNPKPTTVTGNSMRMTLDLLPDVGGTRQVLLTFADLTANTSATELLITDLSVPNVSGTFGVWNQSGAAGTGGKFTRIAIFSADSAADIPATSSQTLLAFMGDSVTQGTGTSGPQAVGIAGLMDANDKSFPAQAAAALANNFLAINKGISGNKTADLTATYPIVVKPLFSPTYAKKIVSLFIGINDIGGTADTPDAIFQRIKAIGTTLKADGASVIVIAPYRFVYVNQATRTNADAITAVDALESQLAANWNTFADAYITLSDVADFATPATNQYLSGALHLNDAGSALLAGRVVTKVNALATTTPSDPYRSDNATPVTILADYKPGAPNPFAGVGLGTFLLPTVVLTWINPANLLGGTIHIMRMAAGTSDPFVVVGTVAAPDANTAPAQTYTDTTVLNGHRYTYTAFATPYGDTTTP